LNGRLAESEFLLAVFTASDSFDKALSIFTPISPGEKIILSFSLAISHEQVPSTRVVYDSSTIERLGASLFSSAIPSVPNLSAKLEMPLAALLAYLKPKKKKN
jgi:hypothetical protein